MVGVSLRCVCNIQVVFHSRYGCVLVICYVCVVVSMCCMCVVDDVKVGGVRILLVLLVVTDLLSGCLQ